MYQIHWVNGCYGKIGYVPQKNKLHMTWTLSCSLTVGHFTGLAIFIGWFWEVLQEFHSIWCTGDWSSQLLSLQTTSTSTHINILSLTRRFQYSISANQPSPSDWQINFLIVSVREYVRRPGSYFWILMRTRNNLCSCKELETIAQNKKEQQTNK